jgi:hypothetical protein
MTALESNIYWPTGSCVQRLTAVLFELCVLSGITRCPLQLLHCLRSTKSTSQHTSLSAAEGLVAWLSEQANESQNDQS